MKQTLFIITAFILQLGLAAQKKDFEGIVSYKIEVKSKIPEVGDRAWRAMLAIGDSTTLITKQGNTKQLLGPSEMYSITKDQKLYMKFAGIDTLYYMDYSVDTTKVLSV